MNTRNAIKLKCLVVDDEPIARKGMEEYVQEISFLQLAGSCENAVRAAAFLSENAVDLILLDIRMPRLSGIDFLKTLKEPPMVILTTAYSEYALEGYSLDVIDYLVKPIAFDRFLKAVQKAYDFQVVRVRQEARPVDYFFIKCDHKYEKVNYADVLYVEAMQNYCMVYTREHKLITYITLSGLEEKLPADRFLKVHKSFIVSLDKIKSVDGSEIMVGAARVPISRSLKDEVMNRIVGGNLFKR